MDECPPAHDLVRQMAGRLSDEELQIMELLSRGWTHSEVAENIHMSQSQLRRVVDRILNVIGAARTIVAVAWLARIGLIEPLDEPEDGLKLERK